MAEHQEITQRLIINGKPYLLVFFDNPTIEDVLIVETRLNASDRMNNTDGSSRKVAREVRNFLIKLGVDR